MPRTLNYHHLLYFWTVANEGSMTAAAEQLNVSQPTLSTQIQKLEKSLGGKLFVREGRSLSLSELGQTVFRYADDIFSLGRELTDAIRGQRDDHKLTLRVGVPDVLPKTVVYQLLRPALSMDTEVRLICHEGKQQELIADLTHHRLDVVFSDMPLSPNMRVRAFNHLLGECGMSILGTERLVQQYKAGFPDSLDGAPMLMQTQSTLVRRNLEAYFDASNIQPRVSHEFEGSSLTKVFAQAGEGFIAVPTAVEDQVMLQYTLSLLGRLDSVRERFYAISVERRLKHPAVVAISDSARSELFSANRTDE